MGISWLHISDFHIKAAAYDQDVVLRALVRSVADYRQRGEHAPDLVFATGDIAYSGQKAQYDVATKFFDALLAALELPKSRLFVIPGNHDVDRTKGNGLKRSLESQDESDSYFDPADEPLHLTKRLGAFLDWHKAYFDPAPPLPRNSTCGPVQVVEANGIRISILPVNSASFCVGDDDHAKLWVGRRCLDAPTQELARQDTDLNIALVHHPFDWLHPQESAKIRNKIESAARLLLHAATMLNPQRILRSELCLHLREGAGWTEKDFDRALDACLDFHVLHGIPDPNMHQLFAQFSGNPKVSSWMRRRWRRCGRPNGTDLWHWPARWILIQSMRPTWPHFSAIVSHRKIGLRNSSRAVEMPTSSEGPCTKWDGLRNPDRGTNLPSPRRNSATGRVASTTKVAESACTRSATATLARASGTCQAL